MTRLLHPSSIRYALALWLSTVLALLTVFVAQIEPAQWAGITVWIIFMQSPRLNYSKIIWWVFGTVTGALMAVVLIALFNQIPDLFLAALSFWLAACAAAAALVRRYKAYGFVLAGYTCAIVSMSAVDHPAQVFHLATMRVSCIFIGMASAIAVMSIMMPAHGHWKETVHHLGEFIKAALAQVGRAVTPIAGPARFRWRHMGDRLSTLEHTLDVTTAESPESRLHAAHARSLVATLSCLLAKGQSIEIHLARSGTASASESVRALLSRTGTALAGFAESASPDSVDEYASSVAAKLAELRAETISLRASLPARNGAHISNEFVLDRLDEILDHIRDAVRDWAALLGRPGPERPSCIAQHLDYPTALRHALRMLVAMGMVSAIWAITQWPSGAQLVLFMAVVCSLLSLVDHAPEMGFAFLKSAAFCATMAFIYAFGLLQIAEGFLVPALSLSLFLIPAAYAYRHPRLIGSAVVSMLIFYGLTMPANQMNYDIVAFLNNGLALLCATACGFFAFHAVPALTREARRALLLDAVRGDLARAGLGSDHLSEQRWTARMFDRLRLLHGNSHHAEETAGNLAEESELLTGLQLGLRQIRLRRLLREGGLSREFQTGIHAVFLHFREVSRNPDAVARFLQSTCERFDKAVGAAGASLPGNYVRALAELKEMNFLIRKVEPLYLE